MLVLNGVNSETNSHEDGTRAHATGSLAMTYPNLSELFASAYRQVACRCRTNQGAGDERGTVAGGAMPTATRSARC